MHWLKCIEFSCAVGWGSHSLSQIDTCNRNKGGLSYTRIEAAIHEMEAFSITQDIEVQTDILVCIIISNVFCCFLTFEYMVQGDITNSVTYYENLNNWRAMQNKKQGMLIKGILLIHDNIGPLKTN